VKRLNLRIRYGIVKVTAPYYLKEKEIIEFVEDKSKWIYKNVKKQESLNKKSDIEISDGSIIFHLGEEYELEIIKNTKNFVKLDSINKRILINVEDTDNNELKRNILEHFQRMEAKIYFNGILKETYKKIIHLGIAYPTMTIRKMKTRWGSCSYYKNRITINFYLIKQPIELIELVILHELIHFVHPNHSKEFYKLHKELMFDYKEREKELKKKEVLSGLAY
ncbi:SprT family zinc-dependent metalloprotease, partial [Clostridiaceae bacterium HSG29]|nr:SprT family zinc-dependent metalloprotease [Clostridiaceae bacterium HSG29]